MRYLILAVICTIALGILLVGLVVGIGPSLDTLTGALR